MKLENLGLENLSKKEMKEIEGGFDWNAFAQFLVVMLPIVIQAFEAYHNVYGGKTASV